MLARAARRDGAALFNATADNPFYLSELLATQDHGVPPSVRDTVLAKLARLAPAARALAEWVSFFPSRAERTVLDTVAQAPPNAIDAALHSGLLQTRDDFPGNPDRRSEPAQIAAAHPATAEPRREEGKRPVAPRNGFSALALSFRHEIARHAVYEALPPERRRTGHAAIFRALSAAGAEPARCVHHAEAAGLVAEVAALAPRAAHQAAATGSHREAARLLGLALRCSPPLAAAERAQLLEARAHECLLVSQHRLAIELRHEACELRRSRDEALRVGDNLRWLARLHWFEEGSGATAHQYARAAIDVLQTLPATRELALAYGTLSHLHLLGENMEQSQHWGLRAINLSEQLDDPEALSNSLNNVGTARLRLSEDPQAWERLSRSLAIALAHGLEQDAARAYNNLFLLSVIHHDFARALRYAGDGISYSEAKGLDIYTVRIRIRRAFAQIVMGQWEQAEADLADVARRHTPSAMESATHAYVASILALRRGETEAGLRLEAAVRAVQAARVEIWFISSGAILAEAAWLDGRAEEIEAIARAALRHAVALGDQWRSGELASWLVELGGQWQAAAEEWNRLGCPYDRALALLAGDENAVRESLAIFEALGATPAAERVRALLRERGAREVPRGPQPRTRGDSLGLTAREREIFELARQGLATAEIAQRLHRSERTVEHHMAAVYRKVGVNKRAELMARHPALHPVASHSRGAE